MKTRDLVELETFDPATGDLNVVVETPKGTRNKYKFDEDKGQFVLHGMLPEGANFPFEFGFLPSTLGGDGDPLDVCVLLDEPTSVGCLLTARPIGVIEAKQKEKGAQACRNDRLITVATHAHVHGEVRTLKSLDPKIVDEMEHFFVSYNEMRGKVFTPIGRFGPKRALKLIKRGMRTFKEQSKSR
jgi:inorganic pyrophosphatase